MTRPGPCSAHQRPISSFDLETTEPDWAMGSLRYPRRQHSVAIARRVIEKS